MKKAFAVSFVFLFLTAAVLAFKPVVTEDALGIFNNFEIGSYPDCYYYNHLTDNEKKAYTAVETEIRSFPEYVRVPLMNETELSNVLSALLYDHPDFFYFEKCRLETIGKMSHFYAEYEISVEDYSAYSLKLKEKALKISQELPTGTALVREKYLHDLLIDGCVYKDDGSFLGTTAVGALIEGSANCAGYAKALKFLLNLADIDCIVVTGTADNLVSEPESHMWNIAVIDSSPCHIDATWDDPVSETDEQFCNHVYFNMTDKMISRTHSGYSVDYACKDESKYYYIYNKMYFTSSDSDSRTEMAKLIASVAKSGGHEAEMMFDSDESYKDAIEQLIENERIYRVLELAEAQADVGIVTNRLSYSTEGIFRTITIIFETGD